MIISYQAITGNNNHNKQHIISSIIISYQAITGNNNNEVMKCVILFIISYQAITGNNNIKYPFVFSILLYHTKR